MYTITDEELNTSGQLDQDPRYTVRDNNGNILYDDVKIELKTPVSVQGTDINKATLEGIQTDLMNETKLLVCDVTLQADAQVFEITGLDLDGDGGIYDIIIRASAFNNTLTGRMSMRLNNDTSSSYRSGSSSTTTEFYNLIGGSEDAYAGISIITMAKRITYGSSNTYKGVDLQIYYSSKDGSDYGMMSASYRTTNNITSIQLYPYSGTGPTNIVHAGSRVQIYKRR